MPRTSLKASRTRKRTEKKSAMVPNAIASSVVQRPFGEVWLDDAAPTPNVDRPRARRTIWSMCWSAAVVAGLEVVAESTEREVALEERGSGMLVARNMWYVWTEARMKREASGITGRPRRRVRF